MDGLHIAQEHASLSLDDTAVEALVRGMLTHESRVLDYLGIVLTDRVTLCGLNKKYRSGDYDTDVLSFPLGDGKAIDGEIYVSLDYAAEHCTEFGASFEEEALRYVAHGLLHLMGYDDRDEEERLRMRRMEGVYLDACRNLLRRHQRA